VFPRQCETSHQIAVATVTKSTLQLIIGRGPNEYAAETIAKLERVVASARSLGMHTKQIEQYHCVAPTVLESVDQWRRNQPDVLDRDEAIRTLLDLGLSTSPVPSHEPKSSAQDSRHGSRDHRPSRRSVGNVRRAGNPKTAAIERTPGVSELAPGSPGPQVLSDSGEGAKKIIIISSRGALWQRWKATRCACLQMPQSPSRWSKRNPPNRFELA
jgi:hypothetical protein